MTHAPTDTTADTVELSTEHGTIFLTGSEIAAIEDDPVLTLSDVAEYRGGAR